jgi:hypothetical protein
VNGFVASMIFSDEHNWIFFHWLCMSSEMFELHNDKSSFIDPRFEQLYVVPSGFTFPSKWLILRLGWRVLRLRMEDSCKYIE